MHVQVLKYMYIYRSLHEYIYWPRNGPRVSIAGAVPFYVTC